MKTSKILLAFTLAAAVLLAQIGAVFAAPAVPAEDEAQNPAGAALASYFADITDYETIMNAYNGEFDFGECGFGVIAQALWLTRKMGGNSDTFLAVLLAKQTGDYSAFIFEDGTAVPENWGQFRKLVLDGDKKANLGVVMSQKDGEHGNNGSNGHNGQGQGNNNGHENQGKNDENGNGNNGQNPDKSNGKNK